MTNYPQPESVYRFFSEIAAIPHGSGNTEGIRRWCLDTAAKLGVDAHADSVGNVILRAPAAAGYETHPRVILQGHIDMVCAKLPDCPKNMETEGLDLIWTDEFLSADGTTLGGDDGIAVAYAFAILADKTIAHPALTVILTVDEETGMDGATGLAPEELDADILINIDSEEEGIFTVGCAGGVRSHLTYPVQTENAVGTRLLLSISGLTGGHSGAEIHKHLLNANVAMLRLLRAIPMPFQLCELQGGVRDNVIPTECSASLLVTPCALETVLEAIEREKNVLASEYPDESICLSMDPPVKSCGTALTQDATAALLDALAKLPNGVQEMNPALGMPETSLNLGIFYLHNGEMHADALIRSGVNAKKDALADKLRTLAEAAGGSASESGKYPAWEYRPDTALEHIAVDVFSRIYGKNPVIATIHAGLECGILAAKKPSLMCISIGPDLFDIHTPRERLSIPSAKRTWDFLLALLKAI